jgi:hypothetical protein
MEQEFYSESELELFRKQLREGNALAQAALDKAGGRELHPRLRGFFGGLTKEQKKAALEYRGPEDIGGQPEGGRKTQ